MRLAPAVLVLALAASAMELRAQVVRGVVSDAASDGRLGGVMVTLLDERSRPGGQTLTDSAGWFEIRAPRPGSYQLQFSRLPYTTFTSDLIELGINLTTQIAARLSTTAIPLNPVVVVARGMNSRLADFQMRQARHGAGHFITQQDIDRRPLARPTTVLIGAPGVTLQQVSRGRGGTPDDRNIITFLGNGGRPCVANVFIDGVPTSQTPATVDERLDVASIAAVEVYARAGTAPAEFQRGNTCGTVLFWTREVEKRSGRRSWTHALIAVGVLTLGFLVTR